ncbi:MAG TPA: hypothetical protein VG777_00275 [Thermoanaerobaculia bacterium]|nr:hypothetical protein [Thermoanaerobaculia bacterium]
MKKLVALLVFLCPLAAAAQTLGVGAVLHPLNPHDTNDLKDQTTFANGPRLVPANGGIWFLESNADRIAFFKDGTITEWPIRTHSYSDPYRSIGANPSDFELDGTDIWFVENGTSGIELNESVFGKLDTVTNEMTEWILPVAKPAGFVREADGTVWIAMSQGSLLHVDLNTLQVAAYRGPSSFAYSGLVAGEDGFFYLTDFGNSRIVRLDPATLTETAWQPFDPAKTLSEPTQPTLDGAGNVYVAEVVAGGSIARLNLATGQYDRFGAGYLLDPTHFFLQGNFIYAVETDPSGGDGRFVIVDQNLAPKVTIQTTPVTNTLVPLSEPSARVRTTTLVPTTFTSVDHAPDSSLAAATPKEGISRFTLPSGSFLPTSTSYSILPINGKIVSGVRGALAEFTLLPSGNATDLVVPLAISSKSGAIRTDFTLYDGTAPTGFVVATFFATPVPPPVSKAFTLGPSVTLTVPDALGAAQLNGGDAFGSLVFTPPAADAANTQASSRTDLVRPAGGTYGFAFTAERSAAGLAPGSSGAVFLQTQPGESSILGFFSPTGATGTATLHGPDGAVRGSFPFFLPSNNRQEYNPAFAAFGAAAESGDWVTFDVSSGVLFPYATLFQATGDAAVEPAVVPHSDVVVPIAGSASGGALGGTVVSELLFANPAETPASVKLDWFPASGAAASETVITVPARGTAIVPYETPAVGLGSVVVKSSVGIDVIARFANRTPAGDFASVARPVAAASTSGRFLVSSDPRLHRTLFLYNRGTAGTVLLTFRDEIGAITKLQLPVGDHRLLVVGNVGIQVGADGGRIEYQGSAGTSLYGWLAATDNITGDSDAYEALPLTP